MDAAGGPRGHYSGKLPEVRISKEQQGSFLFVNFYVLNPKTGDYYIAKELFNPTDAEIAALKEQLETLNKTASAAQSQFNGGGGAGKTGDQQTFNPDLFQANLQNQQYRRPQGSGGGGGGGASKPESKGEVGGSPKEWAKAREEAGIKGKMYGGATPATQQDIYRASEGKDKKNYIKGEKERLASFERYTLDNFTSSRTPGGLNDLKNLNPQKLLGTNGQKCFRDLAKICNILNEFEKNFDALGGYKNTNIYNLKKPKLARLRDQINELSSLGIRKADELLKEYQIMLGKGDMNPFDITQMMKDLEELSGFAHSLPGNSGNALESKLALLDELMNMRKTQTTTTGVRGPDMKFTKKAEAAFRMCNDLITDADLMEEGPFRLAGNFAKVTHALKLFNENKMPELGEYLKKEMGRDDRIDFAKKLFRENIQKIEKSECHSLSTLIYRAIEQGDHNGMSERNMQISFPAW